LHTDWADEYGGAGDVSHWQWSDRVGAVDDERVVVAGLSAAPAALSVPVVSGRICDLWCDRVLVHDAERGYQSRHHCESDGL
jgi:hypothetical protein